MICMPAALPIVGPLPPCSGVFGLTPSRAHEFFDGEALKKFRGGSIQAALSRLLWWLTGARGKGVPPRSDFSRCRSSSDKGIIQ